MNDNMNAIHVNVSMKTKLDIELLKESFHMHTPVVYMNNCAQRYGCSQSYHILSSKTVSLQSKRRVTNNKFNNTQYKTIDTSIFNTKQMFLVIAYMSSL